MSGRRNLLGAVAGLAAVAPHASYAGVVAPDAELVALAAELRALEEAFSKGCDRQDEYDETAEGRAKLDGMDVRLQRMVDMPAEGLPGIAAKAGWLCWVLNDGRGLTMGEEDLLGSLAADLARLAPQAVGGVA